MVTFDKLIATQYLSLGQPLHETIRLKQSVCGCQEECLFHIRQRPGIHKGNEFRGLVGSGVASRKKMDAIGMYVATTSVGTIKER